MFSFFFLGVDALQPSKWAETSAYWGFRFVMDCQWLMHVDALKRLKAHDTYRCFVCKFDSRSTGIGTYNGFLESLHLPSSKTSLGNMVT